MTLLQKKIIDYILEKYNFGKIIDEPKFPDQGLGGVVFFLKFDSGKEIVVKYGQFVDSDFREINFIKKENPKFPVPEIYGFFEIENDFVILLEKLNGTLFRKIPNNEVHKYFDEVILTLNELHKIKKENAWKKFLLSIFNGTTIDWKEIFERKNIDKKLLENSLEKIILKIKEINFDENNCSLLHTDFNQSNFFVDEKSKKITGVIDWEEAAFGDPIYDFSRFHLHLWHGGISEKEIKIFLEKLNLTKEEKEREELYFLIFIIHYLAYYSESKEEEYVLKTKKHQDFLRSLQ